MPKRVLQDITNVRFKSIKLTNHKSSHRRKLLRWLYEVCKDFEYSQYTFATSLLIIDAYVQRRGFYIDEYQLIGISALFISAKIEESVRKSIFDYSIVTDNSYTVEDILRKEAEILEALDYNVNFSLPHCYFNPDNFILDFPSYSIEDKQELLSCVISALFERSRHTKDMLLLYSKAVEELKFLFHSNKVSEDISFYLKHSTISNKFQLNNRL